MCLNLTACAADVKTSAVNNEAVLVCANRSTSVDFAVMKRVLHRAGIEHVLLLSTPTNSIRSSSAHEQPFKTRAGVNSCPARTLSDRAHMCGDVIHIPRGWRSGLTSADVDFVQLAVRTVANPTWSAQPKPVAIVIFPERDMHRCAG